MGTWGTAIKSNDTSSDIYADFFDLYNEGEKPDVITRKLIGDNKELLENPDDSNNFWLTLALALWETKSLDQETFNKVKEIILSGQDLESWRELGAGETEIKKRRVVLGNILQKISVEKDKPKPRKTKRRKEPVFEKGDCLTFKLENGNYGGAVVLEAIKDSEYGHNLIVTTRINQPNKPSKKDFENAEVLVMNYASWDNLPNVNWYLPVRHKQIAHLIERVENIEVQISYDINNSMLGIVADFDINVIQVIDQQLKSEQTKPRSTKKQTIKELTKKRKWKLW